MEELKGMKGLYNKYIIQKADGTPIDPNADYFVLRLDTDEDVRCALRFYANRIENENPILAKELRDKCDKHFIESLKIIKEINMSKPLIELISCESGDWSVLRVNLGEDFEFQSHTIPNHEWIKLIELLGYKIEERIISDEDMEYGNY